MSNKHVFRSDGFETILEPVPDGVDPQEFFQQQIDNCQLCQEARARGEIPEIHSIVEWPADSDAARVVMTTELSDQRRDRKPLFVKRPRWRTMKRR